MTIEEHGRVAALFESLIGRMAEQDKALLRTVHAMVGGLLPESGTALPGVTAGVDMTPVAEALGRTRAVVAGRSQTLAQILRQQKDPSNRNRWQLAQLMTLYADLCRLADAGDTIISAANTP